MDVALLALKKLLDTKNIQPSDGYHFKRWRGKVHDTLDALNLVEYLTQKQPTDDTENYEQALAEWNKANKVCRHTVLSTLSNELYDVYCSYKTAHVIWEILNKKYVMEDAGAQKYAIGNFL